jgi:replicative DNA helicase
MNSLAKDATERLMSLQDGDSKLRGIPTGFESLDKKLSGFQPSDLIILAARPSVGKTSLALDFVRKIAVKKTINLC